VQGNETLTAKKNVYLCDDDGSSHKIFRILICLLNFFLGVFLKQNLGSQLYLSLQIKDKEIKTLRICATRSLPGTGGQSNRNTG
jgi:hypothetical protein